MSKQFSVTRDEMYAWMTEAHESITNVMTEDTGVMIGIIRDSMAEDAIWADSDGQVITDADIIAVVKEWRADNRVEETTPTTPAPVAGTTGTGFETMSVEELREYVATVEGEWQRGEIEGAMGRAVVRQARQRLAEAEVATSAPVVEADDSEYKVAIHTAEIKLQIALSTREAEYAADNDTHRYARAYHRAVDAYWQAVEDARDLVK